MKVLRYGAAIWIFLTGTGVYSQTNIDSLEKVAAAPDSSAASRIRACLALGGYYGMRDFDKTITYTRLGFPLAEKIHDSSSMGEFLRMEGVGLYFKGQYEQAAAKYYRSIRLLEGRDPAHLALTLNDLAKLYRKTRDLDDALKFYDQALTIYRNLGDSAGVQMILNESGVVYEYQGNYEEAINHYEASLQLARSLNDKVGIGYALSFIAGVYVIEKKYDQAENYLKQALTIRQEMNDSFAIALTRSDLGSLYSARGDFEQAISNFTLSNQAAEQLKYPELQSNNYRELSSVASGQGKYADALNYYKQYSSIRDSLFSVEKTRQINELNARYETEKKEQQILLQRSELSRKNTVIAGILALLLVLCLLGYSMYRRYRLKQKARIQAEIFRQQELAAQAVLEAEEKERQRIAKDLHDGVGQMMSAAKMNLSSFENELQFATAEQREKFEKIISLVDESCREVRSVSHSMMPGALLQNGLAAALQNFLDRIDRKVIQTHLFAEGLDGGRLNSNVESVLYRIIQECVNNVIKHAGATTLDISIIRDSEGLSVTIEDNGRGFETGGPETGGGLGLRNIRTRVEYLKGTVEFDSTPGQGTLVAIHIPETVEAA